MAEDREPQTRAAERPRGSKDAAALGVYEDCLLAMARAVQAVGMYGAPHPSAREAVEHWVSRLGPLLRAHGTFSLGSNGTLARVNGASLLSTNPVTLSLLRKLYTTRAGQLELLAGFSAEAAGSLAEFLANADANRLADDDRTLETWIAHKQLRHVRVSRLQLREVKEGDRVVSGDRRPPQRQAAAAGSPDASRPKPGEAAAWAREFKQTADRADRPPPLARKAKESIAAYLRGTAEPEPADLVAQVTRAANNADPLSELILKTALVQQEMAQRADQPVGAEVVTCLRSILGILQRSPDAGTDEGWANLARTLDVLEACVLNRLEAIAGGTEQDAEVIRDGVRAMQHDLEGAALKRDYERKLGALQAVERQIRRFFGLEAASNDLRNPGSGCQGSVRPPSDAQVFRRD